jgi:quinol---cytochrome c reductase cytochrome c subunit, bacillus type
MADDPQIIQGQRVLGVVPGKPPVGDEKVPARQKLVFVWPHLLVRHAVAALAILLLVLVVALLFDAPLKEIANPVVTPNPEKAPWYFVGLQELLSLLHPMIAGVLLPTLLVGGLIVLPYIDRNPARKARFRKVAVWTFSLFLGAWVIFTVIGFAFRGPDWQWVWPWVEWHGEL